MLTKLASITRYALGIKTPIKVAHYITYRCNLRCDMCARQSVPSEKEITTRQAINLQKEFRQHGTITWSFSGGECLLRPDIIKLAKSVKDLAMELIIVTNGILLPAKKEILKFADVINISIDGNKKTHEKLRGKGNYEKALKALKIIKDCKKKGLKKVINTILNNETIKPAILEHMLKLAKKYYCQVGFNLIIVHRPDRRKIVRPKYFPTNKQYQAFLKWLEEKKKTLDGKYIFDDPAFFKAIKNYPDNPRKIKCYAGKFQCSIDPFGKILPCSDFFDYEESYKKKGYKWGYGYEGFKNLKMPKCPYTFCCTTKKNYFFAHPFQILKQFVFKQELQVNAKWSK